MIQKKINEGTLRDICRLRIHYAKISQVSTPTNTTTIINHVASVSTSTNYEPIIYKGHDVVF